MKIRNPCSKEKLLARDYSRKKLFEKASEEVDFNKRQRYIADI